MKDKKVSNPKHQIVLTEDEYRCITNALGIYAVQAHKQATQSERMYEMDIAKVYEDRAETAEKLIRSLEKQAERVE